MNDIPLSTLFSVLAFLLILSAFFSASETSLMAINRYRLRHLVKLKHAGAIKVQNLLLKPDRLLGLILLGNNFVNNLASSIATIVAIKLYADDEIAIAIMVVMLTIIMLIFSVQAPKKLAVIKPERVAFFAAWVYTPLVKIFYPVVWIVNFFVKLILRVVGIDVKKSDQSTFNNEEIKSLVTEAESLMPVRYQKILLGILDFESATEPRRN